jgi:hypothetical protein
MKPGNQLRFQIHESLFKLAGYSLCEPSAMIMEHSACEHVEIGILFFLQKEATMPVILWLLGVPLVVVVVLMLTHVI